MASLPRRAVRKVKRIAVRNLTALRSPLRACVIGFGEIAPEHAGAYDSSSLAQLVGFSDVRPSALALGLSYYRSARAYRDYRQMLTELRPDVVSVCTWPQSHAEIVTAAAEAGAKGIMCEKPIALTLADIETMQAVCDRHGVKLAGGHQYRFQPTFVAAAEAIRSGRLGAIRRMTACIRGSLANNGPHLIDTVRFVLGDPAALRVHCVCRREQGGFNRAIPAEEASTGAIEFANGVRCELATGADAPAYFQVIVEGEKGTLEATPLELKATGIAAPRVTGPDVRQAQFGQFIRWVKGHQPTYLADGEQSSLTGELVLALYEAARVGGPVALPLQNKGDVIHQLWTDQPESRPEPPEPRATSGTGAARLAMDGGPRALPRWFSTQPAMGLPEIKGVTRVVVSKQLGCTDGTAVAALEQAFARYYGGTRAVASTSGTAAIHTALGALGLNPGDEVVTTPLTDMGSVIPILTCNALPIFADIDPATGNMTAETIARKLTPRTKAVLLVHLFGRPADLDPICALLKARGIALVEDCSQAHDAEYHGKKVGTFGDFGTFSFQQSKQITCGDGGITLINRADLAQRAALFVDKGWDRTRGMRSHLFLGMNYRMTELQGAVALAQFRRMPELMRARRQAAEALAQGLGTIPGIIPPPREPGVNPSWWMFPFRLDEAATGIRTDDFRDALIVEGIPVRREYLPVPIFEYDMLKHRQTYGDSGYPFTAFPYEPPNEADFPGFHGFNRNLLYLAWSHNAQARHVAGTVAAVRKIVAALASPSGVGQAQSRGAQATLV